ncbi:MAG TPA: mercury(II) reductase [Methanomicrobiales archaeon]|nr:mercury(II) reductase [Methanomicrobiales archaeon]
MPDGYDLVIIGTGAAGTSAATRAHHLGAGRMVMVEQGPLWGTCVNNGCIPSKFLLAVGEIHRYRNYGHAGLRVGSSLDMHEVIREKRDLILRLRERKARRIFGEFGIELMEGAARFLTPHTLDVGGRTLSARRFIIATGSSPLVPAVDGLSGVPFLTSLGALELEEVPESVIVLGGRSLGLEFAQILAHLGSQVTLLQRSPRIIPGEEPEISAAMEDALAGEGIAVHTGAELVRVRNEEAGAVSVTARVKGKGEKFAAARLLLATGRAPNTGELDLAACGVAVDRKGAIIVDDTMQTSVPHIWAAGDVTGEPMLEPRAGVGGAIAAENAITGKGRRIDTRALPHAIFTSPQVASVGMTESRAKTSGIAVMCRSVSLEGISRALMTGDSRGLVKIVAGEGTGTVLGVHVCAPLAAEIIGAGVLAVKHGLTVHDLVDTFPVFPTIAGAIQDCARMFLRPAHG